MLRKKEVYTTITSIPGFIPRQLAIDILHSHSEVITLNPLVIDHKPIQAPRDAASDEYYSTWYEITERMQWVPGLGKMGSGKIKFNGCFHDMPWGLQTHTYAPMNVDIRIKYRIEGNQPGIEPPVHAEIGLADLGVPADGLYLREDIEIKCNITVISYVRSQLKTASKEMVSRIIKKAELLDAGVLSAMIQDGKIKTINPNDRSSTNANTNAALLSPTFAPQRSPGLDGPASPAIPYTVPRASTYMAAMPPPGQRPGTSSSQGTQNTQGTQYAELPTQHHAPQQTAFVAELPGNFYHPQPSPGQPSPGQPSPTANAFRWSGQNSNQPGPGQASPSLTASSRPTSISSEASSGQNTGYASPALDHKGFASELSTHPETQEEHRPPQRQQQQQYYPPDLQKFDPGQHRVTGPHAYQYNPADYAPR
ncbi:hypothetical protein HYQ45_004042 [Verticillium longisporum]|nr:hypothetical protein HYQ45_004042 [Verticillium longisporum]